MSSENGHIRNEDRLNDELEQLVRSAKPVYKASKEEIWSKLDSRPTVKDEPKVIKLRWFQYAAAAVVAVLLCSTFFARIYSVEVVSGPGQHLSEVLPDGSEVILNAASSISYNPYWWGVSRTVKFEGEGFFAVESGSTFAVVSNNGTTEVLGTSFNINSRSDGYEVLCVTGKVAVSNAQGNVVLSPNEFAVAVLNGDLTKFEVGNKDEVLGWIQNKFYFSASSLDRVFEVIELQYGIEVEIAEVGILDRSYSGYFNKSEDVEEVLSIICQGMGLSFVKQGGSTYSVSQAKQP